MPNRTKLLISLTVVLPLLLTLALINLFTPAQVQAGPLAGFTPSPPDPPDPPPDPPGAGTDDDDQKSSDGTVPTDFVYVQMDRCNLSCSGSIAHGIGAPEFEPLVSIDPDHSYGSLLIPRREVAAVVEVQAPVQFVHTGSGFMVESTLSDQHSIRLAVPYGGQWELFLIDAPHFMTADPLEMTSTNLLQLQAQLAEGPVSLGLVEANSSEPQLVKCPLACVVEAPPVELPTTGEDRIQLISLLKLLFLGGIGLTLIGLIVRLVARNAKSLH